jgi:ParB-like chromosome segregation protein Spo0J
MVVKEIVGNEPVTFKLQPLATEPQNIPLNKIFIQPEDFAFRDAHELEAEDLKPLAEDIAAMGLTTPVLLQDCGERGFLLLDGHRRLLAIRKLARDGVEGFPEDMRIAANVISSKASVLDTTARAISANIQRQSLSAMGRIQAAARLAKLGMPQTEIARLLAVSDATILRDLAVAGSEQLLSHICFHNISATAAATLMKAALDANRVGEFLEELDHWLTVTMAAIEVEVERREASDEDPLSESQRRPQRYFSAELVRCWKSALQSGGELGQPTFRFKAIVRKDKGRTLLEIDPLRRDVADMSASELAKVFQRTVDLADALQPLVVEKAKSELAGNDPSAGARASRGEDTLQSLGLGHLLSREDDDRFMDPDDVFPSAAKTTENDVNVPRSPSRPFVEG